MRIGHPKKGEVREELTHVGFKADRETLAAIDELEALVPSEVKVGRRSVAIRDAIHEARKRLSEKNNQQGDKSDDR